MAEIRATSAPEAVKTQLGQPIKTPPAPPTVRIYAADGSPLDVFPVDAREIVAGGEYSLDPPAIPATPLVVQPEHTDGGEDDATSPAGAVAHADAPHPRKRGSK